MGLYHNVIYWSYDLNPGEKVTWIRNPFFEYKMDPIFKVTTVYGDYTMDLEVLDSSFLETGTTYSKQPMKSFKRIKTTPINPDFTYNKSV